MNDQAVAAERLDRIRAATLGVTVDGIPDHRMQEILHGEMLPTSLDYALIADASGHIVDWLLHGQEPTADPDVCRAGQYVSVPDSYNGSALCGCPNCVEYVAERVAEDEV